MTNENDQTVTNSEERTDAPNEATPSTSGPSVPTADAALPPPPPVPPTPPPVAGRSAEARRERRTGMAIGAGGVLVAALLLFGGFALGHWAFPADSHGGHHGAYGRFERREMSRGFGNFMGPRGLLPQVPRGNGNRSQGNAPSPLVQGMLDWLQQNNVITKDQEQGIQDFFKSFQR